MAQNAHRETGSAGGAVESHVGAVALLAGRGFDLIPRVGSLRAGAGDEVVDVIAKVCAEIEIGEVAVGIHADRVYGGGVESRWRLGFEVIRILAVGDLGSDATPTTRALNGPPV